MLGKGVVGLWEIYLQIIIHDDCMWDLFFIKCDGHFSGFLSRTKLNLGFSNLTRSHKFSKPRSI